MQVAAALVVPCEDSSDQDSCVAAFVGQHCTGSGAAVEHETVVVGLETAAADVEMDGRNQPVDYALCTAVAVGDLGSCLPAERD